MKIWVPPERGRKAKPALFTALVAIAAVLIAGAASLYGLRRGWGAWELLAVVIILTAVIVLLAWSAGLRARSGEIIFCLDPRRRLFYVDASRYVSFRRGLSGQAAMRAELRRVLDRLCGEDGALARRMAEPESLCGLETEVVSVLGMKYLPGRIVLSCRVRPPQGGEGRAKILLFRGYEDEEMLLRELERLAEPEL